MNSVSNARGTPQERSSTDIYIYKNETITGPRTYTGYKGGAVKIGSNVTDSKPEGPVTFNGGEIIITGREIEINSGTTITKGTIFKATTNQAK